MNSFYYVFIFKFFKHASFYDCFLLSCHQSTQSQADSSRHLNTPSTPLLQSQSPIFEQVRFHFDNLLNLWLDIDVISFSYNDPQKVWGEFCGNFLSWFVLRVINNLWEPVSHNELLLLYWLFQLEIIHCFLKVERIKMVNAIKSIF